VSDDRILSASRRPEDLDAALRPKTLDEFVGQRAARENLRVFIAPPRRAMTRSTMCCSSGRRGSGKTTLAQIIARELGVGFRATSGR
jgi:Holliday junction DNA helicase RuvB